MIFLLGIEEKELDENKKLEGRFDGVLFNSLYENKDAKIIRDLCRLRLRIMLSAKNIRQKIKFENISLFAMPEYVPQDSLQSLKEQGIDLYGLRLHMQDAEIEIDGKTMHYPFVMFAAMNGRQEGGGFRLAPNYRPDDGLLDLCLVGGNIPIPRLLLTIPHLSNGTLDFPGILSMQASSVHVHLEPDKKGLFAQTDGETIIKDGYDFYSKISPWKIEIICPHSV